MGQRGLELARTTYNDTCCASEAAEVIKTAVTVKNIEKR